MIFGEKGQADGRLKTGFSGWSLFSSWSIYKDDDKDDKADKDDIR